MSGHDMWRLQKATSHGQGIKVRGVALVGQLEMGLWSFNQQQHLGPFPAEPLFCSVGTLNCVWRWPGRQRDKVRCHLYQHNILERYLAHHQQRHLGILPVVLCEACSLVAHSEIARRPFHISGIFSQQTRLHNKVRWIRESKAEVQYPSLSWPTSKDTKNGIINYTRIYWNWHFDRHWFTIYNKYESNWAFRKDGSMCHLDGDRACLSIVLSAAEDLVLSKYPYTRAMSKWRQ